MSATPARDGNTGLPGAANPPMKEASMDSIDEYSRYDHVVRNMVEEHVGRAHVLMAVQQLAAALDANRWIWQWGDGYGGWVKNAIETQVTSLGLPWDEPRISHYPKIKRDEVLLRSGYQCVNCKYWDDLQVDHIMPSSRGGSNDLSNLQTLCGPCNRSKRAMTMEEWEKSGRAKTMREREVE